MSSPQGRRSLSGVTRLANKPFGHLKKRLAHPPILSFPNMRRPFVVLVDPSRVAGGAALMQKQENEKFHPTQYASRSLSMEERKYYKFE